MAAGVSIEVTGRIWMQSLRRMMLAWFVAGLLVAWPVAAADSIGSGDRQKVQFFEAQVRPILETSCFKCHGGEAKIKGGLRLTSRAGVMAGGDTGEVISLEKPAESLLIKAINWASDDLQMPPKEKLSKDKIAILTKWVEMGVPYTG